MWGTDWTRAVAFLTYREGVDAFRLTDRLSETEKTTLMGATLSEVYKWNPTIRRGSGDDLGSYGFGMPPAPAPVWASLRCRSSR
jgi:hypothetical protein